MQLKSQIILILSLTISLNLSAQNNDSVNHYGNQQQLYWIAIKTKLHTDKEINKDYCSVSPFRNKIYSGKVTDFEIKNWKYLLGGNKIAIGPFENYSTAQIALKMYDIKELDAQKSSNMTNTLLNDSSTYYWIVLKYTKLMRTGSMISLKSNHSTTFKGSLVDFRKALTEGLKRKEICVGPFTLKKEILSSKRLYRLEED